jgi:hypothetical protein
MKKLEVKPRTLDDELVKEGLCAVGALEDNSKSKGLSFVVGGVATQSYLPTVYRRPTTDIDLAVLRPLNYEEFKEFSRPSAEFLKDKGYDVDTKKGHISMQLIYSNGEKGRAAVIEFPRRNDSNFKKREDRLNVEMGNTRSKIIEGKNVTYRVSSPEDIVVPKIVRSIGALSRDWNLNRHVKSCQPIAYSKEDIDRALRKIRNLREEAVMHPGDSTLADELRFVSDIFDIRALSEQVGLNKNYFKQVTDSWDALKEDPSSTSLLINYLLPDMSE